MSMSVKETVKRQYIRMIDAASERYRDYLKPKQGWLITMRKGLGMTGPQMAKRAGVTKAAIYQAERKEIAGEVTIKQMEKYASALGGRFVYAIVPDTNAFNVSDLVHAQARKKAEAIIRRADTHMTLEKQALSTEMNTAEIERLTERLEREQPSDFWDVD
jgi:predicted DNA-binding mobile mystery protein A